MTCCWCCADLSLIYSLGELIDFLVSILQSNNKSSKAKFKQEEYCCLESKISSTTEIGKSITVADRGDLDENTVKATPEGMLKTDTQISAYLRNLGISRFLGNSTDGGHSLLFVWAAITLF